MSMSEHFKNVIPCLAGLKWAADPGLNLIWSQVMFLCVNPRHTYCWWFLAFLPVPKRNQTWQARVMLQGPAFEWQKVNIKEWQQYTMARIVLHTPVTWFELPICHQEAKRVPLIHSSHQNPFPTWLDAAKGDDVRIARLHHHHPLLRGGVIAGRLLLQDLELLFIIISDGTPTKEFYISPTQKPQPKQEKSQLTLPIIVIRSCLSPNMTFSSIEDWICSQKYKLNSFSKCSAVPTSTTVAHSDERLTCISSLLLPDKFSASHLVPSVLLPLDKEIEKSHITPWVCLAKTINGDTLTHVCAFLYGCMHSQTKSAGLYWGAHCRPIAAKWSTTPLGSP